MIYNMNVQHLLKLLIKSNLSVRAALPALTLVKKINHNHNYGKFHQNQFWTSRDVRVQSTKNLKIYKRPRLYFIN